MKKQLSVSVALAAALMCLLVSVPLSRAQKKRPHAAAKPDSVDPKLKAAAEHVSAVLEDFKKEEGPALSSIADMDWRGGLRLSAEQRAAQDRYTTVQGISAALTAIHAMRRVEADLRAAKKGNRGSHVAALDMALDHVQKAIAAKEDVVLSAVYIDWRNGDFSADQMAALDNYRDVLEEAHAVLKPRGH